MRGLEKWKQEIRQGFGARLRELRHRAGLSQEGLALRCNIDRSYVGQVERGERNISLENIHKLAQGLSVEIYELLQPARTPPPRRRP